MSTQKSTTYSYARGMADAAWQHAARLAADADEYAKVAAAAGNEADTGLRAELAADKHAAAEAFAIDASRYVLDVSLAADAGREAEAG